MMGLLVLKRTKLMGAISTLTNKEIVSFVKMETDYLLRVLTFVCNSSLAESYVST